MTLIRRRSARRAALSVALMIAMVSGGLAFVSRDPMEAVKALARDEAQRRRDAARAEALSNPAVQRRQLEQEIADESEAFVAHTLVNPELLQGQPALRMRLEALAAFLNREPGPAARDGRVDPSATLLGLLQATQLTAQAALRREELRQDERGLLATGDILCAIEEFVERLRAAGEIETKPGVQEDSAGGGTRRAE